jgi:hypothetical protein
VDRAGGVRGEVKKNESTRARGYTTIKRHRDVPFFVCFFDLFQVCTYILMSSSSIV